ncbi:MAG: radical SAM protein [Candidatus Zixiibacteriota bacterium]
MFFKIKFTVIFRDYETFGYITDNRNFGYKLADSKENHIGDKIVSQSGAVFLSVLGREPQSLDELAVKISGQFTDVDIETIKNDAREFFCILEQDGFIVSGKTIHECEEKDTRFSYKKSEPEMARTNCSPIIMRPEKTTLEFLEEHFEGKPQLTSLLIDITNKCNERCVHCYIPHENRANAIEPDLFYDVLEQCRNMRLLHLTLSGGEPMMHSHFLEFLGKCRELDFSVNILSNLTMLDDEAISEMKANRLLGVQVSLYSMIPSIHDEITQVRGSFARTYEAIMKLVENDIPLQISCPIIKQNKNSYDEVLNWAKKHNIHVGNDHVIIARYNHTTQNLSARLSIGEVKEVLNDIAMNDTKYLEQMVTESERKKNITTNDVVCSVCHSSICVDSNGNVYPCAGWHDYVVGNVKERSLEEIWNHSEKVQYLRSLRRRDFPKCTQCDEKKYCTMCMVRNANEHPLGDPLEVNEFFCNIAKINRKMVLEWKKHRDFIA